MYQIVPKKTFGTKDDPLYCPGAKYGWFTEGFDTPDLEQAKSLLAALDA
jgi:hypothetical protein